jgi:N-acetylglucosamine-6-sulfatase
MRRGALLAVVLAVAGIVAAPGATLPAGAAPPTSTGTSNPSASTSALTPRPNIVFILTDDLDATTYDPAMFPALHDLMSTQGTTFNHFYVDDSLCCPSRASILRGQFVHNTDVLNNGPPAGGFEKFHADGGERSTVATWIHAAGYRTGLFGKYLNGYPISAPKRYVPPGWDDWVSPSAGNPYGEYRYQLNENGKLVQYGHQPSDYLVDVLSNKATDFIRQSAGKAPFFAYIAPYVPHEPATPAPRHVDAFPGVTAPRTPSFDQPAQPDDPFWLRARPPLSPSILSYTDLLYRRRLQDMLGIEDMLQRVVATLQQTGQLDNTYIFLGSDNGFHLGQHRLPPGKETAYEEDIRVPLLVRGPGVPKNATVNQLAMNVDLAPTFAAIAGAKTPKFVDGRSLTSLLQPNPSPPSWRRAALIEHYGRLTVTASRPSTSTTEPPERYLPESADAPRDPDDDAAYNRAGVEGTNADALRLPVNSLNAYGIAVPAYRALRTSRYLYVEYDYGARQLFDTQADPYEMHDIIGTAKRSTLQALSRRLRSLEHCHDTGCRRLENKRILG